MADDQTLAKLLKENASLRNEVMSAEGEWVGQKTLAKLRKDAERYRWLRGGKASFEQARGILNDTPSGIDAAVDAMILAR